MPSITATSEPVRMPLVPPRDLPDERAAPAATQRAEPPAGTPEPGLSWAQLAGIAEYQSWLRHLG